MNTLGFSPAQLRVAYEVDTPLAQLAKVADFFGLSNIEKAFEDYLDDFAEAEARWTEETVNDWYETAPWRTGNLRNAIDFDDDKFPTMTVGIDKAKLTARAGQEVRAVRKAYQGEKFKISGYASYPEWVDERVTRHGDEYKAVSASSSANPIEPQASREYNKGTHTPFIDEIWFELAKKHKKEIFG